MTENRHFLQFYKSLYITWACFRNVCNKLMSLSLQKYRNFQKLTHLTQFCATKTFDIDMAFPNIFNIHVDMAYVWMEKQEQSVAFLFE